MAAIEQAAREGGTRDLSGEKPEGLEKIRPRVFEMIQKLNVPWNRIILGGFSQGSMLATDIFLRAPEAPKGLLIFSGALLNKAETKEVAKNRAGSKFFMCHGDQDMVLGHRGAAQLETLLINAGLKGSLLTFKGAHEIPMIAIQKANEYLQSL